MILPNAFAGNDKGNAGDGIYVNNEIVMRDFVKGATLNTVEDNAVFLNELSDVKYLIAEIARANGNIALDILRELANTTYYLSETDFPKAANGREITMYWMDGALLISPALFKKSDRAYQIILQTLRPGHTNQLIQGSTTAKYNASLDRAFAGLARYILDNRGRYTSRGLLSVFENLKGEGAFALGVSTSAQWDEATDKTTRCALIQQNSHGYNLEFYDSYFGLSCDFNQSLEEKILASRIKMPGWVFSNSQTQLLESDNYPGWVITAIEDQTMRGPEGRKYECENRSTIAEIQTALKKNELFMNMNRAVVALLKDKSVPEAERAILKSYFRYADPIERLEQIQQYGMSSRNALLRGYPFALRNFEYCKTWGL